MSPATTILTTAALVIITLSLLYFVFEMGAGLRVLHTSGTRLGAQADTTYEKPFENAPPGYHTYFLIPCLNESAVIGATVAALRGQESATVIVIDDASDDDTAEIAEREGQGFVRVLRRELPDARTGKGEALNAAYDLLLSMVAERGQDPQSVIVAIMDADGRLSHGAMSHVLPLFDDPKVGGAQLAVRIRNRDANFLTRFQDFQFWSMSAVTQFGRRTTGTVSLGGNGQFTRLSALEELGGAPWSGSLTEDLDLAISMLSAGWTLETTPNASVDQQGVDSLKRLFVQRRRWYQGHMLAGRRLPEVWSQPNLSHSRVMEVAAYLSVPWLFDLPWSILSHFTLVGLVLKGSAMLPFATSGLGLLGGVLAWYLLMFAPAIATSMVYLRRDPHVGFWRAMGMGHSFIFMNYLSFACVWGALIRIVRKQGGWDKTTRSAEGPASTETPGTALPELALT